ncbi:Polysaccharide biosynthesis protein [uncultured Desulfatiglans sp.]|uniref:Polysaccharide biosynthesis protein n=1 Tax=Uncultured Desulfatiglans sp. TaxID=1748965 RepID=A0A653A6N8_UNCDX|nr:Polysaccharide biosynthesis protein [uncultured Desulfatiglans sp.]
MFALFKRKFHNLISDKKFSEILTGSVWALSARVIATALGMVSSIIIVRWYGAEVLGIVAVLQSSLMLATIFTLLGTNTSILRLIPEHLAKYSATSAFKVYRKTQYFVAGLSVITGAILFFASGFIAYTVFHKPHLRFYFALAAVFIIFESLLSLNTQAVRGLRLIKLFALMQMLPQFCKLIILIPITISFHNLDNPVYAMFASIVIAALVGAFIVDRAFKSKTGANDRAQHMPIREILSMSFPMLMTATMTFVIGQTGVIMLGMFRSEAEIGYYSIAVKLATLTAFVLSAVNNMAAPKFAELHFTDNVEELFRIAKKSAKLVFWITTPILLALVTLGKPILSIFFGEDFSGCYPVLLLLIFGQFINYMSGSTAMFLNMSGHQKVFQNIMFLVAMFNISINAVMIPISGMYGAAIAATLSLAGWNIASLMYIKSKYGKTTAYFPIWKFK